MTIDRKIDIIHEVATVIDGEVRDDYSGRNMYGAKCYGIDCRNAQECIEEAAARGLRESVTDQMGTGFIVYWPSIQPETVLPY